MGKLAVFAVLASLLGTVSCEVTNSIYAQYGFPRPTPGKRFELPPAYRPNSYSPGLKVGYYAYKNCPQAERIVKEEVEKASKGDKAGLIRLHFHDCFVEGCDASVLLEGPNTERTASPNLSLRGFQVIEAAKARLEYECPDTVSCADILAFAGRDASCSLSGGLINYGVPAGRYDGNVSSDVATFQNLPPPFADLDLLKRMFAAKGLDETDMVALSGAHSIGRSACGSFSNSFSDRLLPGDNSSTAMNSTLADQLRENCTAASVNVPQDHETPDALDIQYYKNVLTNNVLFNSDAVLESPETKALVETYARDPLFYVRGKPFPVNEWYPAFGKSMVKMGLWEVKNSTQGQIRKNCGFIN